MDKGSVLNEEKPGSNSFERRSDSQVALQDSVESVDDMCRSRLEDEYRELDGDNISNEEHPKSDSLERRSDSQVASQDSVEPMDG